MRLQPISSLFNCCTKLLSPDFQYPSTLWAKDLEEALLTIRSSQSISWIQFLRRHKIKIEVRHRSGRPLRLISFHRICYWQRQSYSGLKKDKCFSPERKVYDVFASSERGFWWWSAIWLPWCSWLSMTPQSLSILFFINSCIIILNTLKENEKSEQHW